MIKKTRMNDRSFRSPEKLVTAQEICVGTLAITMPPLTTESWGLNIHWRSINTCLERC